MSRIGKKPIVIPAGVEIKIESGLIIVKGPKGELSQKLHPQVLVEKKDNELIISVKNQDEKNQKSLWGLFRQLIANMVTGVTDGFSKQLEINGVGYRAVSAGGKLNLQLGYSHPIEYDFPKGIDIKVEKNLITVTGADKSVVGQTAAEIRSLRKPEPYKGKGIKYTTEVIRRKAGKTAAKGAA
ncbi:MAG: 50S ribosomal protein L6 [Patescibacteria group bacterium]|jgi:large subunit ribosomal protein L6